MLRDIPLFTSFQPRGLARMCRGNQIPLTLFGASSPVYHPCVRPDDKPWYNSEIRRTTRKRDRLKATVYFQLIFSILIFFYMF